MPDRAVRDEGLATLVGVIVRAAQMHGSSVALKDLIQLTPDGITSEDITAAFEILPELSTDYTMRDGLLVPRTSGQDSSEEFGQRQTHSIARIRVAQWMVRRLGKKEAMVVAVSGSTSYKAASKMDDVDLFCVTRPQTMWLFLAKALILTRTSRLFRGSNVPICLSCVMDDRYASNLFRKDGGALFARDALVADVIAGHEKYNSLLVSAPWMKRYFPRLYDVRNASQSTPESSITATSRWDRFANFFLFVTLGSYVKAKARLHNHLLAGKGKGLSTFNAKIGLDHLIYESTKYLKLKEIYDGIRPAPNDVQRPRGIDDPATLMAEPKAR